MVVIEQKETRVCDYCARNSARWFCAADDAFLCQSCDVSVHTANNVARRHKRVRLKSTNFSETCVPVWHQSIIRKPRNPRQKRIIHENVVSTKNPLHLVPESSSKQKSFDEQVLYRVSTFDPLVDDSSNQHEEEKSVFDEFIVSKIDFMEFGVDVESLLGNEKFGMEEIGTFECKVASHQQLVVDLEHCDIKMEPSSSTIFLNLNFERVLSQWDDDKSPWMTGKRPDFNSGDCWRMDCTGSCGKTHEYGPIGITTGLPTTIPVNGEREARVSRYRDKRHTRLFSKKIRYAVRKMNAENRPRIKGRFVKRGELVA